MFMKLFDHRTHLLGQAIAHGIGDIKRRRSRFDDGIENLF